MTTPPVTVTLGTSGATLDDVVAVARHDARVVLADDVLETVGAVRRHVEALAEAETPTYGVSTGFGALADKHIPLESRAQLQKSLIRSHAADMGLTFYTGKQFPEQYRGGLFSAQRGSWNRTVPAGARVMFTPFAADGSGPSGETVPFAEGWLDEETGEYYGRIVDVAQLKDGSLLVSDDTAGAIYRISYQGK